MDPDPHDPSGTSQHEDTPWAASPRARPVADTNGLRSRGGWSLAWLMTIVLAFAAGLLLERALLDGGRGPAGGATAAVPTPMPTGVPLTPTPARTPSPSAPASGGLLASPTAGGTTGDPVDSASPTPGSPETEPPTVPSGPPDPSATQPLDAPANFGVFWEAYRLIRDDYVDRTALAEPNLTYGAIRGMLDALNDPGHSLFLTPTDLKAEEESLQGVLVGIGVYLDAQSGEPTFVSVISGGPAARAGLRAGDRLVQVDDTDVTGLDATEIVKRVRGPEGSTVRVTVIHKGETQPVSVDIVRERITIPAVASATLPGTDTLVIHLVQFSTGAADQFHRALQAGIGDGAKRIVLDLRGDPGGFVNEARAIASEFLASGDVWISQKADGSREPVSVVEGGLAHEIPVVVLVDKGTASSAEIVAGAIQDAKRGQVVGVTTFGTGTLLNVFTLSDGSAVRLGVEQWLTPSGRVIWRHGIDPDVVVELPADGIPLEPDQAAQLTLDALLAGKDTQLAKALELLGGQ